MTLTHEIAPPPADDEQGSSISVTDHEVVLQALASQHPDTLRGMYQILRAHDAAHHHGKTLPDTDTAFEQLMGDYLNHPEHQDD